MIEQTKKCSKCGEWKPLSEYHKKKSENSGFNCQCKSCVRLYSKQYYANNSNERKERRREYYKENQQDQLEYARQYRESHREEAREYARKRRQERSEEVKTMNRASYARNREKWRLRAKVQRDRNPEYLIKYKENNREEIRRKGREYVRTHRDIVRTNTINYRARKAKAEGSHTVEDIRQIYKTQQGLCYYCHKFISWENRHDDHKTPISRGGSNWPDNIAITCPTCNTSKGAKTAEEYFEYLNKREAG